ncbi:cupredoxin domain-containing protein [Roseateles oligotrophus]|uniref:Cupredoxin family protein n=1 Tax=Roseateles oligotrophus TaxID=1769250 RepID=A0ABT2YLA9_9BURK|nr:cupredoxin family protein [Roseateles oligotrophus]MCV2370847.1 cupredoxin family protein [Roseateles oligotrophus]
MKSLHALAFAALSLGLGTAFAHGDAGHAKPAAYDASKIEETAFGREGNPKKVSQTIRVDMADSMRFSPENVTVKRGQTIKFVLHNNGKLLHEMVLGTVDALKQHAEMMRKFPNMEHSDPNMSHVKPGAKGEIVWQFTKAGEFQFACLQPGHFEAGMIGRVLVK